MKRGGCENGRAVQRPTRFRRGSMATNETAELDSFGTTADEESAHDHEDGASAEECWCTDDVGAGTELSCFDAWMAERDARGEF